MIRRAWIVGGVAIAAGAAGAGWAWWQASRRSALGDAEQAFWSMRFEQPGGGELAVASLRGRPLVLNFWATWCPPCVKEMPMLDAFQRQHRAAGWQVLGLAVDSPTPVREFLARQPVGFAIGLAGLQGVELSRSLGNGSGGLPFSIVFDREGRIATRRLGAIKDQDLRDWVQQMG